MAFSPIYGIQDRHGRNTLLPYKQGSELVNDGSTLSLDFTTGGLDPRLSFSRQSNATFVDSDGFLVLAPANMVPNSVWDDATALPARWGYGAATGSSDVSIPAQNIRRVTNTDTANQYFITSLGSDSLGAGLTYYAQVEITEVNGTVRANQAMYVFHNAGGTSNPAIVTYIINGATAAGGDSVVVGRLGIVFTVNAAGSHLIRLGTSVSNGGTTATGAYIGFTKPHLVQGTHGPRTVRYYPNSNTTTNAGYYAPRFDYDPSTLAPRGLLIEGSSTNLLTYSEDYSQAAWTKSVVDRTTGQSSPDGTTGATLISENATSYAKHGLERTQTITAGVHTFSVWLKEPSTNSRRYACIQLADGQATAARYTIVADLQTGTITASGATNGTAGAPTNTAHSISTPYPGGWYHVTITMNLIGSASYPVVLLSDISTLFGGPNQPFYSATTPYKGLIVWGAQFETGSGASSYIPTSASQGMRNRDELTLTNLSSIAFSQTSGTAFAHVEVREKATGTFAPYGSFDTSGGGKCWWWLRHNRDASLGTRLLGTVFNSGGSTAITTSNYQYNSGNNGLVKFATSLDTAASSLVYVIGGGSPQTTTASAFTLATAARWSVNVNNDVLATDLGSMWMRSFKYWPTNLPNATLQSLTT